MMKHLVIHVSFVSAGFVACSGYDGGGDARIVPIADDSGASSISDGGPLPDADASVTRETGADAFEPPKSDVIAYYPLDGSGADESSASQHRDFSINATFASGRVGQALSMSTAGYGATRASYDEPLTFGTNDFTVQAWISTSGAMTGVGTIPFTQSTPVGWILESNGTNVYFVTDEPQQLVASPGSTTAAFRHCVVRRKGSAISLFVDGVKRAERQSTWQIGRGQPLGIQRAAASSTAASRVDEVVVWSRALDDSEVVQLHQQGANGLPPNLD
jgi:hypothetical protein